MRFLGVVGALVLASVPLMPSLAQTSGDSTPPTVTIINKGAQPPVEALPELTVSPVTEKPAVAPTQATTNAKAAAPAGSEVAPAGSPPAVSAAPAAAIADTPAASASEPPVAATEPPPEPTLTIDIDLGRQSMTVSEHGEQRYSWTVSTAAYGYRTPTGTFTPTWMSKMWYSRQYDNAPMPHAVFFHKGVAIHATYATRSLGRPASHGCVRLAPKNAATLFKLVSSHGKERTQIVVHGRPDHSSERIASSDRYGRIRRGTAQRYLPPSAYAQRGYNAYGPPPGYAYGGRQRGYYQQPRRYQPRGLYNSYSYGYGF
jgi:lipoprotein-anchoring transpeptidase ErfK/SrfK